MKTITTILGLTFLSGASLLHAATPALESGGSSCEFEPVAASACNLHWDLSATPRSAYVVEWLNPSTGQWEPALARLFRSPFATARDLSPGRLYRVRGCNNLARKRDCVSTTAIWAPVIPKDTEIPASVPITAPGGDIQQAAIAREASRYTKIMQLNVYLLSDVLGRATEAGLPPMSAPLEPGTPGDLAHNVHHNVYSAYESVRKSRRQP
jgi:hypothetical protein